MAIQLGKRKRPRVTAETRSSSDEDADAQEELKARFQRAFQSKFQPLQKVAKAVDVKVDSDELSEHDDATTDDDGDDWTGMSDEEAAIEVIEVQQVQTESDSKSKLEKRAFMSHKLPGSTQSDNDTSKATTSTKETDEGEAINLKNDVALQRLLKESHLLDANASRSDLGLQGKSRLKALDLRLQDLGAKESHLEQAKMPLSHRRGIQAKVASKERNRRKDAAENGIILEKVKTASRPSRPREKSIGGPNIGKFKGGMLNLSSRDLQSIEGRRQHKGRRRG